MADFLPFWAIHFDASLQYDGREVPITEGGLGLSLDKELIEHQPDFDCDSDD